MKFHTLALIAALAAAPLSALAQQAPPSGGPMGGPGMDRPSMQQMQQMRQLHAQARAKILAALTPAHKALVAKIVGDLAVANEPNEAAAIEQLDAALSPAEKTAILNAHDEIIKQMHAAMGGRGGHMEHPTWHGKNSSDPGAIVLMMSHPMGGPPPR